MANNEYIPQTPVVAREESTTFSFSSSMHDHHSMIILQMDMERRQRREGLKRSSFNDGSKRSSSQVHDDNDESPPSNLVEGGEHPDHVGSITLKSLSTPTKRQRVGSVEMIRKHNDGDKENNYCRDHSSRQQQQRVLVVTPPSSSSSLSLSPPSLLDFHGVTAMPILSNQSSSSTGIGGGPLTCKLRPRKLNIFPRRLSFEEDEDDLPYMPL